MKHLVLATLVLVQLITCSRCFAQNNFFTKWEDRVRTTSAQQPSWPVPVVTVSSGLVQLARIDFIRQYTVAHTTTWNYGNSKGFNLIPFYKTEIDINLPPYIEHNAPKVRDGAGDFSVLLKYRPFSGNEKHGNYSTSFSIGATAPTGSYKNGTAVSTITPTVIGGKGLGKFDIQSSLGATLPTSQSATIGRPVAWNTVAQFKIANLLWPELEVNSTYYHAGPNDGKTQTFLTPGLMVSKIKFMHNPKNRLSLIFGSGMQIATSHYHSYNHGLVFTSRITF